MVENAKKRRQTFIYTPLIIFLNEKKEENDRVPKEDKTFSITLLFSILKVKFSVAKIVERFFEKKKHFLK